MNGTHLAAEELNLLVDDRVDATDKGRMHDHLAACAECQAVLQSLVRIDRALRNSPVERTNKDFTRNVLAALSRAPGTPFLYRIVENLSYVFALMVVASLMLTIFVATGAMDTGHVVQTQTTVSRIGSIVEENLSGLVIGMSSVLQNYFSFLYNTAMAKLSLRLCVAFVALILFDRVLKRKLFAGR